MLPLESNSSQPLIIAGMHRSGTSLTASILEQAGVFIGDQLLKANVGNVVGHFEDEDFLHLHQNILIAQGVSSDGWSAVGSIDVPQQFWRRAQKLCDRRLKLHKIWGWKEPRTTLFLPFWKQLLPQAKFILPYRSPWEVVDSLFLRGDPVFENNPNFTVEIWLAYNRMILDFYQIHADDCFLFHCDLLKTDETALIQKINAKFDLTLTLPTNTLFQSGVMHADVNSTHRPTLLAHYFPKALATYTQLQQIADVPTAQSLNIDSQPDMASYYRDWVLQDWRTSNQLNAEIKQLKTHLETVQTDLQNAQADLRETRVLLNQAQSEATHWRLTIEAMEKNRFWQMRNAWLSLKKTAQFWRSH
ncbi:MAG: sulfotransferase [Cyanobacteria bacterium P01_C01_bin.70]